MMKKTAVLSLMLVGFVAPVAAYETNVWQTTTVGNTPETALDWLDSANWSLGSPPAAGDSVSFASRSGVQYVRLPENLTLCDLRLVENTYLVGERLVFSSAGAGTNPRVYNGWIFADVTMTTVADEKSPWVGGNYFCGRLIAPYDSIIPASGMVCHRLDRYATSSNPLRTDDLQGGETAVVLHPGNASYAVYAAGAAASASAWSQTEGSPYLSLADASAAPVAVGATVTGAGIPEGTFVRRRFTDLTHIELSQPVAETLSSNVLSFAAFNPDVRLHVQRYIRQGNSGSALMLCKYLPDDNLQLEIDTFGNAANGTWWEIGLSSSQSPWLPGTLVLHTVGGGHRQGPSDKLHDCHLVFAGTDAGGNTVFGESRIMAFADAVSTARLDVPEGVGEIANFTNLIGTLVKEGAGTLKIGLADAVNAGALVVAAGTLELAARGTAGVDGVSFASLTMAAGTTLRLPETGMTVSRVALEDGATVCGPGTLKVMGPMSGRVTCLDGARIVYAPGSPGLYAYRPEAQVAGHPAFWVDASKSASLETVEEDGITYVTRWNDWRDGEPMFCTNVVRRPQLVTGETPEKTYVKISYVDTLLYTNTECLVWSQPIDHIRAIFLVQDPSDGGGEILGRTTRLPDSWYGSQGGPFYRATASDCNVPFISPNYATPCVKFGRFFRNGEEVKGYQKGYLGNFMQLVEHHVNTNYAASTSRQELCCDAFGSGGYQDGHVYNHANGRQRIAECLIYTNSLTHAERVQTALYLSRKWLGKDIVYSDIDEAAFVEEACCGPWEVVHVPADFAAGVRRVENGSALEKTGGGLLVVDSLDAGEVTVTAGELRVKSLSLANTSVPDAAWVHVDASDAATLSVESDGDVVTKWRNLTGDGQEYRPLTGSPKRVANALNGLPVVDCGTLNGADKAALILHRPDGTRYTHADGDGFIWSAPYFKSVFIVYGSQGGGNSLLGCWGNGYPWQGLAQMPKEAGLPLFSRVTGSYTAWKDAESQAISNETIRVRLNGVRIDPFTTPFSGGYDMLSVNGALGRKSDTLATFGQNLAYAGGLSYGEVLVYSNLLDVAVQSRVEAYLRKKWFNADSSGCRQSACAALRVAAGARVSVGDWAAAKGESAYEVGTGVLTTALLGGGGTVSGRVELAAGGVFEVVAADGCLPTLTVEGSLAVPADATLHVTGDVENLPVGRYTLVSCSVLDGPSLAWTVEAPARPHHSYALTREGGDLVLSVANAGTLLIFR
ncbi:MAG: hypothetical protein ACI4Q3_07600 [Kiritimatiellia bacterium]